MFMVPRHKKYIRCMVDMRDIIVFELWEGIEDMWGTQTTKEERAMKARRPMKYMWEATGANAC